MSSLAALLAAYDLDRFRRFVFESSFLDRFELEPELLAAYEPRILALIALDRKPEAREALAEAGRRLTESGAEARVLAWHCSTTAVFQKDAGDIEEARETWSACLETHPTDVGVVSGATIGLFFHREAFLGGYDTWRRRLVRLGHPSSM